VASGSDAIEVEANCREIDLSPTLFAAIVTGSEVERKKPAPDIFLEACARLGLEPAAWLVIEDAVNGVRAAKAAGTRCLALTTSFLALTGSPRISPTHPRSHWRGSRHGG